MRINPKLHKRENKGSALLLVVVVTMLLSVIGIIFIMTARLRGIAASGVTDSRDLDAAVQSVVSRVNTVLVQDLFGTNLLVSDPNMTDSTDDNEPYDYLDTDPWLASLEPTTRAVGIGGEINCWPQVTDLFNDNFGFGVSVGYYDPLVDTDNTYWNGARPEQEVHPRIVQTKIITPGERVHVVQKNAPLPWPQSSLRYAGARADADGDGVADSRWMIMPNLTTAGGKPVYAAVRIIDNCAMLNLNAAYCFYQDPYTAGAPSPFLKSWFIKKNAGTTYPNGSYYAEGGQYLSEINYLPFLRGRDLNLEGAGGDGDRWYRILSAKGFCLIDNSDSLGYTLTGQLSTGQAHQILMNIENPGSPYSLFNLGDELEICNRFLLTGKVESRFEQKDVGNYTFDAGGGVYAVFETPVDDSAAFTAWKIKMNPANFDLWRQEQDGTLKLKVSSDSDYADSYKYDRRHLCTFYSFDRNLRYGKYPNLEPVIRAVRQSSPANARTIEEAFRPLDFKPIDLRTIDITSNTKAARRNILHLLYAFREQMCYSILAMGSEQPGALAQTVKKAAQQVANMIDYLDNDTPAMTGPFADPVYGSQVNANPTYITKAIIDTMLNEVSGGIITTGWPYLGNVDFGLAASDKVYGYERQPFISEVYTRYVAASGGAAVFALELVNPYDAQIDLNGWNIKVGTQDNKNFPVGSYVVPAGSTASPGRLVISSSGTGTHVTYPSFGLGTPMLLPGNVLRLQRPDPANAGQFLTVDEITDAQRTFLVTDGSRDTSRRDTGWGFVNNQAYPGSPTTATHTTSSLGTTNTAANSSVTLKGYALPVANNTVTIDRFADFQKIAWVDPNALTDNIAKTAGSEELIRFKMAVNSDMLGYLCTLSREEKGIPGRININTAPMYVIAAAIPPQLVATVGDPNSGITALSLAQSIVANRIVANRPYRDLGDLMLIPGINKFANMAAPDVGEMGTKGDLEEEDWIINRLSNIFTVRSDTFTAYILVRLGTDGPQRRMIAIFDRSNCWSPMDKPKLVALHLVPDPR